MGSDDQSLRTIKLSFPRTPDEYCKNKADVETWITMLEQMLSCDFNNYNITVTTDRSLRRTEVEIVFASVGDAVLFRLQQKD